MKKPKVLDEIIIRVKHRENNAMPYLATYQRVYKVNGQGDDQTETKQDTFILLASAISWIDAQIADGWANQGSESTQVEITKTG